MKKYISILELFGPILDHVQRTESLSFNTMGDSHYFLLGDHPDGMNKVLTFLNLTSAKMIVADNQDNHGREPENPQERLRPFRVGHAYTVPNILEIELLKHRLGDRFNEETYHQLESLMYQYYLVYHMIKEPNNYLYDADLIEDLSVDGELYTISEDVVHELDFEDENAIDDMMKILNDVYESLNARRAITNKHKRIIANTMPIETTFEGMQFYANYADEGFYYDARDTAKVRNLPLMLILIILDDLHDLYHTPTFASYIALAKEMFSNHIVISSPQPIDRAPTTDYPHAFFSNGAISNRTSVYGIEDIESDLEEYLGTHILDILREAYFKNGEVIVSSREYDNFDHYPWGDNIIPALILNSGGLTWNRPDRSED